MEAASRSEFEPLTPDPVEPSPVRAPQSAQRETAPASVAPIPVRREAAPAAPPAAPVAPVMDRDFIARNQIVERYLSGKLPIKGATEFERFCKEHPELLDEMGLPDRVNAGLRLLEASGKPEPWEEPAAKKPWEKPHLAIGLGAAVLALLVAVAVLASGNSAKAHKIAVLTQQVAEQPLEPATTTRTIRLLPSRQGASSAPAVVIGTAGQTQLADLKVDMSHSPYREFRVTIDRIDQGRVAIIHNLTKDSNGHLRLALNSSALGPGNYQLTIEGLTWRGDTEPDSWITIGIQH
jgi:hypothetical protein